MVIIQKKPKMFNLPPIKPSSWTSSIASAENPAKVTMKSSQMAQQFGSAEPLELQIPEHCKTAKVSNGFDQSKKARIHTSLVLTVDTSEKSHFYLIR